MPTLSRSRFGKLFDEIGTVDQVGIEERVAKFTTRSIKKGSKVWGLKTAVSMVDLTTLEGKDTPGKIASLCQKARRPSSDPDVPPVAAVCSIRSSSSTRANGSRTRPSRSRPSPRRSLRDRLRSSRVSRKSGWPWVTGPTR
jgi:Deoxyribose-phosphate aldolase